MVFYFTGTGNSLYIAKMIEKNPISIPQAIHHEDLTFADDAIGIVAPIYGYEVPLMVKEFMKKAQFHTDYFYMILTYGNRHGGAAELAYQLCRDCQIDVKYINVIVMVDNWLPSFDMDEQVKIDKKVEEHMQPILEDLQSHKNWIAPVSETDRAAHQQFLANRSKLPEDAWQHLLTVSDACVGCGICEKVCPSGSVHVKDGKAVFTHENCQTCLACAHACPNKAILTAIPEKNPQARYRNPHIALNEIIQSNYQERR